MRLARPSSGCVFAKDWCAPSSNGFASKREGQFPRALQPANFVRVSRGGRGGGGRGAYNGPFRSPKNNVPFSVWNIYTWQKRGFFDERQKGNALDLASGRIKGWQLSSQIGDRSAQVSPMAILGKLEILFPPLSLLPSFSLSLTLAAQVSTAQERCKNDINLWHAVAAEWLNCNWER